MRMIVSVAFSTFCLLATGGLDAASGAESIPAENPAAQRWQIGMTVQATGACSGILAAIPVPMDWPEQQVKVLDEQRSDQINPLRYRTLAEGAKQMLIVIPQLAAGDTASALVTFEVRKSSIPAPDETGSWRIPARAAAKLRPYLGVSPSIETTHPEIRRLAAEIVQGKASDWDKVRAIYDWVRTNVKYQFDPELKGALTALRAGQGDCEELTSLFIALCRANGIPARSVWVPGHCYPEFYLEAPDGQGRWFPCQAAGADEFGSMRETRPILQKGDTFRVPGEAAPKRYVAETFRAQNAVANPRIEFIRKQLTE
ncbi:MAG TPA: transglutaminase-like domain-containing protein [Candidatus Anammoximicrobium sp.]|nr:transglutaminase-like domain-containing protein [Candidatus Anammoximicrobium sp.]